MTVASPLIPGLDEIVRRGDSKRLAEVSRGIAELFVQGAAGFQPRHVALFDHLLTGIVPQTELAARAELAERIASVANAPPTLIGQLAREDNISIAGPVLRRSPVLDEILTARFKALCGAESATSCATSTPTTRAATGCGRP